MTNDNTDTPAYPIRKNDGIIHPGLTKRELLAAMAMQGFIASHALSCPEEDEAAEFAVKMADALLSKLGEKG